MKNRSIKVLAEIIDLKTNMVKSIKCHFSVSDIDALEGGRRFLRSKLIHVISCKLGHSYFKILSKQIKWLK